MFPYTSADPKLDSDEIDQRHLLSPLSSSTCKEVPLTKACSVALWAQIILRLFNMDQGDSGVTTRRGTMLRASPLRQAPRETSTTGIRLRLTTDTGSYEPYVKMFIAAHVYPAVLRVSEDFSLLFCGELAPNSHAHKYVVKSSAALRSPSSCFPFELCNLTVIASVGSVKRHWSDKKRTECPLRCRNS